MLRSKPASPKLKMPPSVATIQYLGAGSTPRLTGVVWLAVGPVPVTETA